MRSVEIRNGRLFYYGSAVGYLEQEPKLDDAKTVREVVEEGCAATVALLKEYEEINMKLCEPLHWSIFSYNSP